MKELNISEEQLKELVLRVLGDLEAEERTECMKDSKQILYILYISPWNERYMEFLKKMEGSDAYDIVPITPLSQKNMGCEARPRQSVSFGEILYRFGKMPDNLNRAVTPLPAAPRDILMRTASCINDAYETSWVTEYMEQDSRVVLFLTDLEKSSGDGKSAYRKRIMEYYRQVLGFGVEICSTEGLSDGAPCEISCEGTDRTTTYRTENSTYTLESDKKEKRVISSSNVGQFISDGVIYLQPGGTVTNLAKGKAKFLKIIFK